jgi:DNA modification methylase
VPPCLASGAGRDFVGIELNPHYVKMAEARLKYEKAQIPLL